MMADAAHHQPAAAQQPRRQKTEGDSDWMEIAEKTGQLFLYPFNFFFTQNLNNLGWVLEHFKFEN